MAAVVAPQTLRLTISGMGTTVQNLYIWQAAFNIQATQALRRGAGVIRAEARRNISRGGKKGHRWTGDLEKDIRVGAVRRLPYMISIRVGIGHFAQYPVGHSFEYGWHGRRKRQPPTAPIQIWVQSKLGIADDKKAKRVAFLIARKIGKSGYSFGEDHFIRDAAATGVPAATAIIVAGLAVP